MSVHECACVCVCVCVSVCVCMYMSVCVFSLEELFLIEVDLTSVQKGDLLVVVRALCVYVCMYVTYINRPTDKEIQKVDYGDGDKR